MGKIWFTSDTHFGSERTLELSKRPFSSIEEMDSTIISNWNLTVGKNDTVIHLGDFGEYGVARQLNGDIKLIMGNYEDDDHDLDREIFRENIDASGMSIVSQHIPYKLNCDMKGIVGATHKPTVAKRYVDIGAFDFMLFGHIHKLQMVKRFGLNVGVDCHSFKPIDVNAVNFYRKAIDKHYDYDVFC